ncbi:MAG TPA: FUSC family protein [Candidatus Acidoferrales bacterium]
MLNPSSANFRLAIKTALAGCLGMYFASLLRMPQPYWAAISAMIVMQINLGAAVKQSWIRFAATAVGAAVSVPFMAVPGQKLLVFGVAVFVTIVLCTILHLEDGIRLAAVTIAIIMLVPNTGRPWVPALNRFLEVSFGILIALVVAEFVLPSTALESLRHALAEKFLQLDTFLSALLLRFRGENVVDVAALRANLATLARQNADLHAHGRYEPARWSARRIALVKLLQHEERMSKAVETLDAACDGVFCGGIDLQWEPEFSELCAGISAALQRIAEGILTGKFWTPEYDFAAAIQALDARANAARISVGSRAPTVNATSSTPTLEGVLRQHTIYFALQSLARELAAAQVTARELVATGSANTAAK